MEQRALIKSVNKAKEALSEIGAQYKGDYHFTDSIFVEKNKKLSDGYARMRVYQKNNWPTKKVLVTKKERHTGKLVTMLHIEFQTQREALRFIQTEMHNVEIRRRLRYEREGWEYELKGNRVFVEDIENYKPTIEIEAANEKEANAILKKIGATKHLKESVPEMMQRILS